MNPPTDAMGDLLYLLEQHRRALISQILIGRHLSFSQWLALKTLWAKGPCSMTELAKATAIDRTSLTRTIDSLIAGGCVVRTALATDRRAVIVQVSGEGAGLASQLAMDVQSVDRRMLALFDADQQQRLAHDLGRLLRGLTADETADFAPTDRSRSA